MGKESIEKTDDSKQNSKEYVKLPFDKIVRILIMNRSYQGIYHSELCVSGSKGMLIDINGDEKELKPGSEYILKASDFKKNNTITIRSQGTGTLQIHNLERKDSPQYRGILECYPDSGGIVVVNELSVEEYLYGVVPSEMPSSYPEEALKAQAISARTYTYFHKQEYAYPQWKAHMDDSTSFQVYMNVQETENTSKAVDATKDQVLSYQDTIVESFYYSTSGGFNGGAGVWKDRVSDADGYLIETGDALFASNNDEGEAAYKEYIDNGNMQDAEYYEAWYRWDYDKEFDKETVKSLLQKLYQLSLSQPEKIRIRSKYLSADKLQEENQLKDIRILRRRKSGLVAELMIETEHFKVSVMTQYTIRQVLGCAGSVLYKNDGTAYTMGELLPSAYFYIEKSYDNNGESGDNLKKISVHGAGLGHGCGMSQNGAKCLAERGLTAEQILAYYYNGGIKAVDMLENTADDVEGAVRDVNLYKNIQINQGNAQIYQ